MGIVTQIRTSGDNDESIHPVRYEMNYYYCDECGSFDLKHWKGPDNYEQMEKQAKNLGKIAGALFVLALLAAIIAFQLLFVGIILAVLFFAIAMMARFRIKSAIKDRGVYCNNCGAQYEYGSAFFTDKENPRELKMEDVPRPLNANYSIRGAELKEVEKEG